MAGNPMLAVVRWLAGFLASPIVSTIIDGYKSRLQEQDFRDRAAAELAAKAIEAEIAARKSADALIISEQEHWYTAGIRPLLAMPVIIYLWKVVVWDKVLGWGATDAIQGEVGTWAGAIVTAYVGGRSLEKIAATIWGRK